MNDFDNIVKDKIGDIQEMPPAHLWENISAEINAPVKVIPFYKSSKFAASIAVASIVVVLGLVWMLNGDKPVMDSHNTVDSILQIDNSDLNHNIDKNNIDLNKTIDSETIVVEQKNATTKKIPVLASNIEETNTTDETSIEVNANTSYVKPTNKISKTAASDLIVAENKHDNIIATKQIVTSSNTKKTPIVISLEERKTTKEDANLIAIAEVPSNNEVPSTTEAPKEKNIHITEPEAVPNEPVQNLEQNKEQKQQKAVVKAPSSKQEVAPLNKQEVAAVTEEPNDDQNKESNIESTPIDKMPQSDFHPRMLNVERYSIGAHFGLENIKIDDINIATYNADLSFNYQNMSFIAQTGIGFQMSKDRNDYSQHILTNEYKDTQIRFDSLTFVSDGNGGVNPIPVSPTYVDIYDSINHTYSSDVTETYYSIRIPLMIGYQKGFKKLGFFAKGGVIFSHIFKNNSGSMNELEPNSRLLNTEYDFAERRRNQLQYVLSTGVSYQLSKRMSCQFEIMGKYYQYAMYTNSNTNPWSYEARLGLTYLLN